MGHNYNVTNETASSNLLSRYAVRKPWRGTLFIFAAYNYWLSDEEVHQKFELGFPRAACTPLDISVTFDEDTEENNTKIQLIYYDLNAEVAELLKSFNITQKKYTMETPKVFIFDLPDRGNLYQMDGTPILHPNTQIMSPLHKLIFVPPKDAFSDIGQPYTEFSYFVTDPNKTMVYDTEYDTGRVTIYIDAVNDSPTAISSRASVPSGFNHSSTLYLVGTDVDDEDASLVAYISDFPIYGELYYINEDGSYGIKVDKLTGSNGTEIYGDSIGYMYNGKEMSLTSSNLLASDNFTFFVVDNSGVNSAKEFFYVDITSSVVSIPSEDETE
eukprot:9170757-Ditylum_brightwellii.AAC.1